MKPTFFKDADHYRRNLNFIGTYIQDAALYLHLQTQQPIEQCEAWVRKQIGKGGKFEVNDPRVKYLEQVRHGQREMRTGTMSGYLRQVAQERYVLSPTMTAYTNPNDEVSVLAEYVAEGLTLRSQNKKEMLKAKDAGDKVRAAIYNNRQNRNKIKNNSLSGAHGTPSSVLFKKSSHSTLTSTCRSASSNTNTNIERFLSGNRHYWSVNTAINNIVSVIRMTDFDRVKEAINYFDLAYPTVDQTLQAIKECTDQYWHSDIEFARIARLVNSLSDIQRAAFLYSGDMYHLAKYNDAVVRRLYDHIARLPEEPVGDSETWINELGEDEIALMGILCNSILKGRKLKDKGLREEPEFGIVGAAAKNIVTIMDEYALLFEAFWVTPNVCPSMAAFPVSVRRVVVASDTDSSIFTNQDWTSWYVGDINFRQESFVAAAATTYLCSQLTTHVLAVMSGSMGVADHHLRMLQMKNEYAFKFFALTTMAKHYFATMNAQEGNVYAEPDWEIKGVTLKNSTAPAELSEQSDALIKRIAMTVLEDKKLNLTSILQEVADKEHEITRSVERGDPFYFRQLRIKPADAYKNENSPYLHYRLWKDVFAEKYGDAPEPTYTAIAVKVTIKSKRDLTEWLDGIEDQALAARMVQWMQRYNKSVISSFNLPQDVIRSKGIPRELVPAMNIRDMIKNLMKSFYLILESLGYFIINKNVTRLISDDLPPSAELLAKWREEDGR